jgi:hypothetical protein
MESERQSMDRELYASTISRAIEYFEGYATLAVILNVSVDDLRRWAHGESRPPVDVFLRIVDLTRRSDRTPNRRLN